jgi:beta-mannosidase
MRAASDHPRSWWALEGPWWLKGDPGPGRTRGRRPAISPVQEVPLAPPVSLAPPVPGTPSVAASHVVPVPDKEDGRDERPPAGSQPIPPAAGPRAPPAEEEWREVPPATHLQPWLYPDNPYWGPDVRQINDSAWWYCTRFALPREAEGRRLRLVFEAVDYYAEVWCNGQRLGQHEGNFCPFRFDLTDLLREENELLVRVAAPWDPLRRKGLTYVDQVYRGMVKGLYEHNDGLIPPDANPIGIWRPVWLEAHAEVTIERLSFEVSQPDYDGSVRLTMRLAVHNRSAETFEGVLHVYLAGETFEGLRADDNVPIAVPPGEHVIEQVVRVPDPHWWWPWDLGRPDLYRLRCTLYGLQGPALDQYEELLGLRHVQLIRSREALHYQVNKVPYFVRGTTYMGGLYLSQLAPQQIEADLDRVQECGLNLIRLHVHVAPPELYAACDRRGILVWQDFELNWIHDFSVEFEERAVGVLHEMLDLLGNHPSVITWCCHNEPTALFFQDRNLEHPDRRLYREVMARDPSRPAFLCSGRHESDWRHCGDAHAYVGAGHGGHYLDVYGRRTRLVTEFGSEAPLNRVTLDETPLLAKRLAHLRNRIDELQAYQARLLKYQIEWYRVTRFEPCGGYIQFMLVDLYPQVGCGVLDPRRRPKAGFQALKSASQPVHVLMEHTASGPEAIWVVNDLTRPLLGCLVEWQVLDQQGETVTRGSAHVDVSAQRAYRVTMLTWNVAPDERYTVLLRLSHQGSVLDENRYDDPFHPPPRPKGFPWLFDPQIGMRCYGGPHARSSLRVLNTWYGRLATWLFPVYQWAEEMLAREPGSRSSALLKKLFG